MGNPSLRLSEVLGCYTKQLNLSMLGEFYTLLLSSADFFFQNLLSPKIHSGVILSDCQTVWIQIRADILPLASKRLKVYNVKILVLTEQQVNLFIRRR